MTRFKQPNCFTSPDLANDTTNTLRRLIMAFLPAQRMLLESFRQYPSIEREKLNFELIIDLINCVEWGDEPRQQDMHLQDMNATGLTRNDVAD